MLILKKSEFNTIIPPMPFPRLEFRCKEAKDMAKGGRTVKRLMNQFAKTYPIQTKSSSSFFLEMDEKN